jgi:hypothetical protein
MVEVLLGTIAYLFVTTFGGFLSSWMSFNASGEKFDPRKHGNALITGAMSGLGWAVANIIVESFTDMNEAVFLVTLVGAFFMAFGIDRFRADGSKMIARNAVDSEIKPSET